MTICVILILWALLKFYDWRVGNLEKEAKLWQAKALDYSIELSELRRAALFKDPTDSE